MERVDVERLIRALTGGDEPKVGDTIVWTELGWKFRAGEGGDKPPTPPKPGEAEQDHSIEIGVSDLFELDQETLEGTKSRVIEVGVSDLFEIFTTIELIFGDVVSLQEVRQLVKEGPQAVDRLSEQQWKVDDLMTIAILPNVPQSFNATLDETKCPNIEYVLTWDNAGVSAMKSLWRSGDGINWTLVSGTIPVASEAFRDVIGAGANPNVYRIQFNGKSGFAFAGAGQVCPE